MQTDNPILQFDLSLPIKCTISSRNARCVCLVQLVWISDDKGKTICENGEINSLWIGNWKVSRWLWSLVCCIVISIHHPIHIQPIQSKVLLCIPFYSVILDRHTSLLFISLSNWTFFLLSGKRTNEQRNSIENVVSLFANERRIKNGKSFFFVRSLNYGWYEIDSTRFNILFNRVWLVICVVGRRNEE